MTYAKGTVHVGGLEGLFSSYAPGSALVALIVGAVLAVWRGLLVPRWTVDKLDETARRVAAVQAERLADSQHREEEWRAAWLDERKRGDLQARQIDDLLEVTRTTETIVRSLKAATAGGDTG